MVTTRDLANICDAVYGLKEWNNWENKIKEGIGYFPGFRAAVYEKAGERVIAFAGTDLADPNDVWNDVEIGLQLYPSQGYQAREFYLASGSDSYPTTITGHSLGGALADLVGNEFAINTSTFNSPGTLGLIKWEYGYRPVEITKNPEAEGMIFHYLIKEDPVYRGQYLGQKNVAYQSHEYISHYLSQWTKIDRYNSAGDYGPDYPVNKYPDKVLYYKLPDIHDY